jgi:transposase, IS5 family
LKALLLARRYNRNDVTRGTLVDATVIASANKDDDEARWIKHRNSKAVHG